MRNAECGVRNVFNADCGVRNAECKRAGCSRFITPGVFYRCGRRERKGLLKNVQIDDKQRITAS